MLCSVAQSTATENAFSMARVLSLFARLGLMVTTLLLAALLAAGMKVAPVFGFLFFCDDVKSRK